MRLHLFGAIALTTAAVACTNSDADPNTAADDGGSSGTAAPTTIPLTTVSGDGGPGATITDSSAEGTSTGTDTVGSSSSGATTNAGTADGSSSEGTNGDSDTSSSGSSGGEAFDVDWCILQFPAQITTTTDAATPVYARLYVEGVTDLTEFVDEHRAVVVEFGYGEDDTLPDDTWGWIAGIPNPGWDGTMAGGLGSENNDEYYSDLSFSATGNYDYAARVSGDSGATWVYCDLDGLAEGGYTTDQAGQATVEQ